MSKPLSKVEVPDSSIGDTSLEQPKYKTPRPALASMTSEPLNVRPPEFLELRSWCRNSSSKPTGSNGPLSSAALLPDLQTERRKLQESLEFHSFANLRVGMPIRSDSAIGVRPITYRPPSSQYQQHVSKELSKVDRATQICSTLQTKGTQTPGGPWSWSYGQPQDPEGSTMGPANSYTSSQVPFEEGWNVVGRNSRVCFSSNTPRGKGPISLQECRPRELFVSSQEIAAFAIRFSLLDVEQHVLQFHSEALSSVSRAT